ncbi:MAG: Tex family protein [Liquorilactobacillus hordei]
MTVNNSILDKIAKQLNLKYTQVQATAKMYDEGATVPFMARYRKEKTGNLDEVKIREILDNKLQLEKIEKRRVDVENAIQKQEKLTPLLKKKIEAAVTLQEIEDLYLPFKKKRRTRAMIAKEAGIEPFARWLMTPEAKNPREYATKFVNPAQDILDVEQVVAGACDILAEEISENALYRTRIRQITKQLGKIITKPKKIEVDEQQVFKNYYDFIIPYKKIANHQILAINRGERLGIISTVIQVDEDQILDYLSVRIVKNKTAEITKILRVAIADGYKRLIKPAIERELRNELTQRASEHAIEVFGSNLYHLLMQSPLKGKCVLGFDPAYRTGCKLAVVDETGKFKSKAIIYPHQKKNAQKDDDNWNKALKQFVEILENNRVDVVAIGNGTASRESEAFVAEAVKQTARTVVYAIVNEAGASVYSASKVAREEFPDFHVEERSAVSIARRLQDPLAELVKIDPQAIGVGQYQYDLPQKELGSKLDAVIETAVNQVGIDLNTASPQLLQNVSGLSSATAANIVTYRNEIGTFKQRNELKKVPRLGPKAYEQAAGFLRIVEGKNFLDNTDIHPESYQIAKALLEKFKIASSEIGKSKATEKLKNVNIQLVAVELGVGEETLTDIIASLIKPGRDIRSDLPPILLRSDVLKIADLKPGMKLKGTVRNVIDFGAFVDIGVKQDGLVHLSQLKRGFVKNPNDVVAVGDIVDVWVLSVDEQRKRIQLTMISPEKS